MKTFIAILLLLSAFICSEAHAQMYVDTGDCKIQIPKGYQLILETNSSERTVFESTTDLSTINFNINKNYKIQDYDQKSSKNRNLIYSVIAKNHKYVVVKKTRIVRNKKIGFIEIYLTGLRIALIGPNNNWNDIVDSCK